MSKTVIIPIISAICFFIQPVFHINISESVQSQLADVIVNGVLLVSTIVGIFKSFKK
jgi:hypothetical protein